MQICRLSEGAKDAPWTPVDGQCGNRCTVTADASSALTVLHSCNLSVVACAGLMVDVVVRKIEYSDIKSCKNTRWT